MRYYVTAIQHNKEKDAENRIVPFAFDTLNEAKQKFHEILGNDMKNATLDWSVCYLFTSEGTMIMSERWTEEITPVEEV